MSKTSRIRQTIFWFHLVAALLSALFIALMSVTGIAIAFEEEIIQWFDRDVSRVQAPPDAQVKSVEELITLVRAERPEFEVDHIVVPADRSGAYEFRRGWGEPVYVNPYTGASADTRAHEAQDVIDELETWHRFAGFRGEDWWLVGRHINGAANLVFLFLCVSGLYLWFPRVWSWRRFKDALLLQKKSRKRARHFGWHRVAGFWGLPGLIVIASTGAIVSYEWGHAIPFVVFGEEPSESRAFGMMAVQPAVVPPHEDGATPLRYDEVLASIAARFPNRLRVGVHLREPNATEQAPLDAYLILSDPMPSRAWVPLEVDPFSGEVLQSVFFDDRSPGLRARVWARFVHTGAGFGVWGKLAACFFTALSLLLVYTGLSMTYLRFFKRRRGPARKSPRAP